MALPDISEILTVLEASEVLSMSGTSELVLGAFELLEAPVVSELLIAPGAPELLVVLITSELLVVPRASALLEVLGTSGPSVVSGLSELLAVPGVSVLPLVLGVSEVLVLVLSVVSVLLALISSGPVPRIELIVELTEPIKSDIRDEAVVVFVTSSSLSVS